MFRGDEEDIMSKNKSKLGKPGKPTKPCKVLARGQLDPNETVPDDSIEEANAYDPNTQIRKGIRLRDILFFGRNKED